MIALWTPEQHDQHCPARQGGECIHEDGCKRSATSKIGSASSIPADPSLEPSRGGEADPTNLTFLIRDPALRGAVMGAYRAWEKRQ